MKTVHKHVIPVGPVGLDLQLPQGFRLLKAEYLLVSKQVCCWIEVPTDPACRALPCSCGCSAAGMASRRPTPTWIPPSMRWRPKPGICTPVSRRPAVRSPDQSSGRLARASRSCTAAQASPGGGVWISRRSRPRLSSS